MISKDGHIRILDFGLAKLVEPQSGEHQHSDVVTSPQMTRAGLVVGTIGYMSPEQAAGRAVDFRSDQFSFGVMLYELASGVRPFQRETGAETMTAILREMPPPLSTAAPSLPLPLRWIIEERCLAKDPEDRYASTRDLLRELRGVREHLSDMSGTVAAVKAPLQRVPAGPDRRARRRPGSAPSCTVGLAATPDSPPVLKRVSSARHDRVRAVSRLMDRPSSTVPHSPAAPSSVFHAHRQPRVSRLRPAARRLFASRRPARWPSPSGNALVSVGGALARWRVRSWRGGAPREVLSTWKKDWSPDGRELAVVRDMNGVRRLEYPIEKVRARRRATSVTFACSDGR
jgi:serine/threonine protein kinase